jgi:hypothetical protein
MSNTDKCQIKNNDDKRFRVDDKRWIYHQNGIFIYRLQPSITVYNRL